MKKKALKITAGIVAGVLCCAISIVFGLQLYGKSQMRKIPALSFHEALSFTLKENTDAKITVGIIKDGKASYTVYGENGSEQPAQPYTYEIGSLTKTFTAARLNKAVQENKIDLNAAIDRYLPLPAGKHYPTVKELVTHTSGYKSYYFERPMVANFFKSRNDFYAITKDMVLKKAASLELEDKAYPFRYSNFGYAVLGILLEEVYGQDYTTLMNQYLQDDLGLKHTTISGGNGDLGNYWDWKADDAYVAAGALTATIEDMLSYAQQQMDATSSFKQCHKSLEQIHATTDNYKSMGIHMDEIGMAWMIDKENNIVWHNGGTGNYNCYMGFQPEKGTAVVILSNCAPGYRIPATVLGVKQLKELNQ